MSVSERVSTVSAVLSRREALVAGVTAAGGLFTGCTVPASESGSRHEDRVASRDEAIDGSGWPQVAHDAWNTSYTTTSTGPRSNVEVAWTASPGDVAFFQPVVTDDVYVTEDQFDGAVYALDETDGSVRWNKTAGPMMEWPPAIHDDTLFVLVTTEDGRTLLNAFDRRDGTLSWTTRVAATRRGPPPIAPTVAGGRVFVPAGSGVTAVAIDTGEIEWTTDLATAIQKERGGVRSTIWTTPTVRGGYVYTFDQNEGRGTERRVYAFDRDTGTREWTTTLSVPREYWGLDAHVLASTQELYVIASGRETQSAIGGVEQPPPSGGGRVYALDPESGQRRWSHDVAGINAGMPALADEMLYLPRFQTRESDSQLVALNTADQTVAWTTTFDKAPESVAATPETLYVGGRGLDAINPSDGTRRWRTLSGHNVGAPVVAQDSVYASFAPEGEADQTRITAIRER